MALTNTEYAAVAVDHLMTFVAMLDTGTSASLDFPRALSLLQEMIGTTAPDTADRRFYAAAIAFMLCKCDHDALGNG